MKCVFPALLLLTQVLVVHFALSLSPGPFFLLQIARNKIRPNFTPIEHFSSRAPQLPTSFSFSQLTANSTVKSFHLIQPCDNCGPINTYSVSCEQSVSLYLYVHLYVTMWLTGEVYICVYLCVQRVQRTHNSKSPSRTHTHRVRPRVWPKWWPWSPRLYLVVSFLSRSLVYEETEIDWPSVCICVCVCVCVCQCVCATTSTMHRSLVIQLMYFSLSYANYVSTGDKVRYSIPWVTLYLHLLSLSLPSSCLTRNVYVIAYVKALCNIHTRDKGHNSFSICLKDLSHSTTEQVWVCQCELSFWFWVEIVCVCVSFQ